jgi:uncharacterized protein
MSRSTYIDQLRGISLVGIILVNAPFMAISTDGISNRRNQPVLDTAVQSLISIFAEGRFFLIFSLLFGYSAFRFMKVETPEGQKRFKARLLILALLGFLHAVFFFIGDILFSYAIIGLLMLRAAKQTDEQLLKGAKRAFAVGTLLFILFSLIPEEPSSQVAELDQMLKNGSFFGAAKLRLFAWPIVMLGLFVLNWTYATSMMYLGAWMARQRILDQPSLSHPFWKHWKSAGLGVGLTLSVLLVWLQLNLKTIALLSFIVGPLVSYGYVGFTIWMHERNSPFLRLFQSAGKMSLSCYLLESILLSILFCGWGLGWFGKFGSATVTIIALCVCVLIELFAKFWIKQFDQGPLESWTKRLIEKMTKQTPSVNP